MNLKRQLIFFLCLFASQLAFSSQKEKEFDLSKVFVLQNITAPGYNGKVAFHTGRTQVSEKDGSEKAIILVFMNEPHANPAFKTIAIKPEKLKSIEEAKKDLFQEGAEDLEEDSLISISGLCFELVSEWIKLGEKRVNLEDHPFVKARLMGFYLIYKDPSCKDFNCPEGKVRLASTLDTMVETSNTKQSRVVRRHMEHVWHQVHPDFFK